MSGPAMDPQRLAEARALFEAGKAKVSDIAAMLNLTPTAFYRLRLREGWKRRQARKKLAKRAMKMSPPKALPAATVSFDENEIADRIETAVEKGVVIAAKNLGASPSAAAERNARLLTSLTKALTELRKLKDQKPRNRKGQNGHVERPARDMATLRADIARRLEQALRPQPGTGPAEDPEC